LTMRNWVPIDPKTTHEYFLRRALNIEKLASHGECAFFNPHHVFMWSRH
jgi:hypothetical protein